MGFFIMLIISLMLFFIFKPLLGIFFAGILSVIVFTVIFLFNRYSSTTGLIKSNMRIYFYYRKLGFSHDESLSQVIQTRRGVNPEDILKLMGETNISLTVETEKEALKNLVYLIFCLENGIPPTEAWKENMYKKMSLIYDSFSRKYGVEDRRIIYTKLLEENEAINLIKNIIDCYNYYRKKTYPHDVAIEMAIDNLFSKKTETISHIRANFQCWNIYISSVGGFKDALYGRDLNSFGGPFKSIAEKGNENKNKDRVVKIIAENLRDSDYLERDLKILIFIIYDFLYPVEPAEEIYEKRIKQINKIYNTLDVFSKDVF